MDHNFRLSDYETEVYHLLHDLDAISEGVSDPATGIDCLAIRSSYEPPHRKLATIEKILEHHENAIRTFLAQQSGALETVVHGSTRLLPTPSAHVSKGAIAVKGDTERCHKLLDAIAGGLATASRFRQSIARSSSRIGDGLESLVGLYQKPHDQHRNDYGLPGVMDETLYRLYPTASCGGASSAPPVPNLRKRSTDRELSLTEKVLLGQGMIEVPLGESYWVPPRSEREQHPVNDHRGENFSVQRTRNDYGNSYQKPLYGREGANVWY